jgi:solute carrier family 9B (sodium/hydrogen exchanger), member 1/2
MLLSVALIITLSLLLAQIFSKLRLPSILGMLISGVILGPYVLNLIDPNILDLSTDLRQIALIVILVRAGLSIDLEDIKKIGRPAIFLAFIPATIEMLAITFLAPLIFGISYLEAAIMGSIVAAVSPAIVVPRMIKLMESGHGAKRKIPHLILAGASIDDIYVIVIFMSLIQAYQGQGFNLIQVLLIPVSIALGILLGIVVGLLLVYLFKKIHMRDTIKVLIIFSVSFFMVVLEHTLESIIPISGLIGVMILGATILKQYDILAKRLVGKFEKIWVIAEIMLFVLVGAAVNITVLETAGLSAVFLILVAMVIRLGAVYLSLLKTSFTTKEKIFVGLSYMPKATVQAAIGSIPLALGILNGHLILTVAVLAIMVTAPLGAILMDRTYKILLEQH